MVLVAVAAVALMVWGGVRVVRLGRHVSGRAVLVTVAVTGAMLVAIVGGVRSFQTVSAWYGVEVPIIADGMIIACTALRLAALSRGWRIPGSLAVTWTFLV